MPDTPPAQKRSILVRPFLWIGSRPAAMWTRVRPERRTLRAISFMTCLATILFGSYTGYRTRLSADLLVLFGYDGPPILGERGFWFDVGAGAVATLLLIALVWVVFALILRLGRWLPTATGKLGLGSLCVLAYIFDRSGVSWLEGLALSAIVVVVIGAVFGSIAVLTSGRFGQKKAMARFGVWAAGLLGLAGAAAIGYGVVDEGSTSHLTSIPANAADAGSPKLALPDPGEPGSFGDKVATLTYGSGTDLHRPEFAAEAQLKTRTVNGRPFAKMPSGHRGKTRDYFWRISMGELPLNGRVWYPKGDGPFPLVLIVHGNHDMREFSDPGYEYLGQHLASHGYILCSVDENFLNGLKKENDARGWLLLEHLAVWKEWNATQGNPFFGKVDLNNIALIGHSRGGEAVTHAALFNKLSHYPDDATVKFDYGFAIKSIVSIAPVDGQYKPAGRFTRLRDINYFTIHGTHDADVTQFQGDRIYHRLQLSPGSNCFKATLCVYRANHGQFNTVWGSTDSGLPRSLLLNRAALLPGDVQRKVAKVFITAFLEATLRGKSGLRPLFVDPRRGRDWTGDVTLISRYEDSSFRLIADYEEDADVTTTTVPGGSIRAGGLVVFREGDIGLRGNSSRNDGTRFDQGVYLGWDSAAEPAIPAESGGVAAEASAGKSGKRAPGSYEITLPDGFMKGLSLTGQEQLVLHVAQVDEKPKAKDYSKDAGADAKDEPTADGAEAADKEGGPALLDFSVELRTPAGTVSLPLSRYGALLPPLEVETNRTRLLGRQGAETEITPQVFALPLADFKAADAKFDPAAVTGIRLVFDRQPAGVVVVDRIGIADSPR